jgi:hypothetical protein
VRRSSVVNDRLDGLHRVMIQIGGGIVATPATGIVTVIATQS